MSRLFPPGFRMFFLREIGEPQEHCLRIVITEAKAGALSLQPFAGGMAEMADVTVDPSAAPLELVWEDCAAYAVYQDRIFAPDPKGPGADMLVESAASPFLEYVRSAAWPEELTGRLRHWRLSCLQHVIDVASTTGPRIGELPPGADLPLR